MRHDAKIDERCEAPQRFCTTSCHLLTASGGLSLTWCLPCAGLGLRTAATPDVDCNVTFLILCASSPSWSFLLENGSHYRVLRCRLPPSPVDCPGNRVVEHTGAL